MKMRFHPIQRKFEHENITFKMDALTLMIVLVVYTVLFVGFVICMFLGWIDVKGSIYVSYVSILLCSIAVYTNKQQLAVAASVGVDDTTN